jgi:tetratricopeptide (TPR) repeat protein
MLVLLEVLKIMLTDDTAEENYEEASIVDPNNPAPLISLCSTNFERGDYCNAINYIQKVLSLSQARNLESQDMQNLYYRAAQCFLYLSRPEPAKVMAQNTGDRSMRTALLYATEKMQIFHEQVDLATHRSLVMDRLHRFKPSLYDY